MAKMQAPAGCTGASFGGVDIPVVDGFADVPESAIAELRSHGFVDYVEPTPEPAAGGKGKKAAAD